MPPGTFQPPQGNMGFQRPQTQGTVAASDPNYQTLKGLDASIFLEKVRILALQH